MKGKLIPNNELLTLPIGTKLLIHCIDKVGESVEHLWLVCLLIEEDERRYLIDAYNGYCLTEVDDLDGFCKAYEYNEEDAQLLVEFLPKDDPVSKNDNKEKISIAIQDIQKELQNAISKYSSLNSAHEGYSVILEKLDELWDEIKQQNQSKEQMRNEAVQVAAMALRFIIDVCA